ncbi:hypothetical protein EBR78_10465 [bacterium]|nr:hypothetical protein [bacterium]
MLGAIVPLAFIASRSVVEPFSLRYLLCLQLVLCIVLALFLNEGWQKKNRGVLALGIAWLGLGIWTNMRAPGFYRRTEVYPQLTQIADVAPLMTALEENAVFSAYSDYWPAYLINFVSQGRFTLEPLYSNYLPFYEEELKQQDKVAIIKAKNKKNSEPLLQPQSTACAFKNVEYRVLKYQDLLDWELWILSR